MSGDKFLLYAAPDGKLPVDRTIREFRIVARKATWVVETPPARKTWGKT
jgi:hypothetical protein